VVELANELPEVRAVLERDHCTRDVAGGKRRRLDELVLREQIDCSARRASSRATASSIACNADARAVIGQPATGLSANGADNCCAASRTSIIRLVTR